MKHCVIDVFFKSSVKTKFSRVKLLIKNKSIQIQILQDTPIMV